ncbi:M20/M25/M40 family metallo-hydrolase [Franconibacter pulveris 601]
MTGLPHPALDLTLELLESLTPWRSDASDPARQRDLAAWLEQWLVDEVEARVVLPVAEQPLTSPPLVHARIDVGAAVTVVLYNRYDVAPAAPEGWEVDPFLGGVRHWPQWGDVFIARGAQKHKGPLAGMLMTVRELWQNGLLHVNLEIVLEGEQACGSATLRRYLAQASCPIPPAEAVLFPAFCEQEGGVPRVYLGFTGMTQGAVRVKGGDWGGPRSAIDASHAAWVASPAWRLVEALNAIAPAQANGVLETRPLDVEAAEWLDELAQQCNPEAQLGQNARLALNASAYEALAHLLGSAVLTISELKTASGGQDVIAPEACAAFTLRTPPGSDPQALLARLRERLMLPDLVGAELHCGESYPGMRFSAEEPGVMELLMSYQQQQARAQIWPWSPECAPASAFAPVAPAFVMGGLGSGGNACGVNEFITLKGLARFQRSLRDWLLCF